MNKSELLSTTKNSLRLRGLSARTEEAYAHWVERFISFLPVTESEDITDEHVREFLFYLYDHDHVSAATRNLALSAVRYLFERILKKDLTTVKRINTERPAITIFSDEDIQHIFDEFNDVQRLIGEILLTTGVKLMECITLRVHDIDIHNKKLIVRDNRGFKIRETELSDDLTTKLEKHLKHVYKIYQQDLKDGFGRVYLPFVILMRNPKAEIMWEWQYVFPASRRVKDSKSGLERRHFLSETVIQRALKTAVKKLNIEKPLNCHSFRHTYAVNKLRSGLPIQDVQKLLGHKDIRNTMVYADFKSIPDDELIDSN